MHINESLIKLFPQGYVKKVKRLLIYADDKKKVSFWLGKSLFISLIISIISSIIALILKINLIYIILGIITTIFVTQFVIHILIYFKVDTRKTKIEESLPDALQLISSNLHAGMTPYQAIKLAARKEFGPLAKEFKEATDQALGTKNFSEELMKIGDRVDSSILRRTLKLINSSLSSGGHLAGLLEELSEDIAETQSLKDEMVTNTKTYTMFIMFTVIVGTPLLLAISVHFVGMVEGMQSTSTLSGDEFGIGFLSGELTITPEFLTKIAFTQLAMTSVLASMLTGTITKGEMAAGFKYAPAVAISSILLFFLSKFLLVGFFAGI